MALFDWSDWNSRIVRLFPKSWAGGQLAPNAFTISGTPDTNGRLGSVIAGLAGGVKTSPSGLPFISSQLAYAKLQTRMATITDTNVDQVALDWFAGVVPRVTNEPDRAYASRLLLTLTADCPSIPGLTKIIQAYITAFITYSPVQAPLAADTSGAADTVGGADVVAATGNSPAPAMGEDTFGGGDTFGFTDQQPSIGGIPTIEVFDETSDPTAAAFISLHDPEFCIFLDYANASVSEITRGQPFTEQLAILVNAFSAPGTIPVYASNAPT